jgi:hypothetical protein
VAVIQISKIQVRRGQKNSNSGIPQLSSAEFAWAVDSQELYIGNGSVLEGAPYVGNTKVLTEHDNILELAGSYTFASTDPSISLSVPRSLQSKLDEYVSVADFGAIGDGSTDCVEAFETAFTELFRNVNTNYKKVLIVPNGNYLFLRDLRIPSGVLLKGETAMGVVLNIGASNIRFIASNGDEIANFDSTNRPINVNISNITIQRTTGQFVLSGVADSTFDSIRFIGDYELGDPYFSVPVVEIKSIDNNVCTTTGAHNLEVGDGFIPRSNNNGLSAGVKYYIRSISTPTQFTLGLSMEGAIVNLDDGGLTTDEFGNTIFISIIGDVTSNIISSLGVQPAAVFWDNELAGIKTNNIKFISCEFESNCLSIKCLQTAVFDTVVKFDNCKFFVNDTAIYIRGVDAQGNNWQINDCEFEEIHKQAFRSTNGRGTLIQRTKFKNCGNGTGDANSPIDNIVYFGEKINNVLVDCTSDRQQAAGVVSSDSITYIPEVYNGDRVSFVDRIYSTIYLSDSFRPLAVFSALSNYITIHYFLSLDVFSRVGKLTLTVGDNLSQIAITDEYQYSPPVIAGELGSDGGAIMTNFEFTAQLRDNDADSGIDTILLSYKNPLPGTGVSSQQSISFNVIYGV